ncbi:unnamed protein product [Paramecium sonneborni]|uniref:Uncharacterized protein n=1 Tax=Paramecium sonneborni TaxID=65129 RepID=A0A8S1RQT2_9CILI|nr:unnamed protein product [Paramecium sonneborni]
MKTKNSVSKLIIQKCFIFLMNFYKYLKFYSKLTQKYLTFIKYR